MNKIYLVFVFLFIASFLKAQVIKSGPQEVIPTANAINVAVSLNEETLADDYFVDADRSEKRGELNDALALFGKAAFEYNIEKKYNRYASSLLRMSNVHLLLTHYVEAEQIILNSALKTYSKIGNKSGQMLSYNQLGKIYLASNRLTQSLWFYTQQGILAQQLKDNHSYIESILGIVAVKIKKKEYAMAIKDIDRAEILAKNAKTTQFVDQIRTNRAIVAERQTPKTRAR
jgi:tetratricopeptide (TPR) repeat protein